MRKLLILLVVFSGWCFACWLHWRGNVAVIPTWTLELTDCSVEPLGNATAPRILRHLGQREENLGPIEILYPGEDPVVRKALRPGDQLSAIRSDGGLGVVRRHGATLAIDLFTNQVLTTFAGAPADAVCRLAGKGQVLLIQELTQASGYDVATGQRLWSHPSQVNEISRNVASPILEGAVAVHLWRTQPEPAWRGVRDRLINVFSGEEPAWLAALPVYRVAVASPCGRYIYLQHDNRETSAMHDAVTGQVLWTTSGTHPGEPPAVPLRFSPDGNELIGTYFGKGIRGYRFGRWMSASGKLIEAPPMMGGLMAHDSLASIERFQMVQSDPGVVRQWLDWAAARLNITIGGKTLANDAMFDMHNNREVGLLTTSGTEFPADFPVNAAGGDQQLLVSTRRQLKYYSFPPRRDWGNLFTWCLAPPLVMGFAWEVIRSLRRQYAASGDSPVAEPGEPQGQV